MCVGVEYLTCKTLLNTKSEQKEYTFFRACLDCKKRPLLIIKGFWYTNAITRIYFPYLLPPM